MVAVAFAALVVGDTTIYRSQLRSRSDSLAHRFGFGLPQPAAIAVTALMSPPRLVLPATTPAAEALQQLRDGGLPGAPIVNSDGAFIGSIQTATLGGLVDAGETANVGRLADVEAMTLPAESGLDAAIDAIPASKGGWVPVLDDDMHILGIIAPSGLIRGWQETMRQSVRQLGQAAASTTVLEGTIGEDSTIAGRPISALGLPPGTIVISALRHGAFLLPTTDEQLRPGDTVTVLLRPPDVIAVRRLLGLDRDKGTVPLRAAAHQDTSRGSTTPVSDSGEP